MDDNAREIRRRSAEILSNMTKTRDELRAVQEHITPKQFRHWALHELGLDDRTLQDILAFNGTMNGMTERMLGWVMRSIEGGRLS